MCPLLNTPEDGKGLTGNCNKKHIWNMTAHNFSLQLSWLILGRRQIDDIILVFPRKQNLTFHENCLHWRNFT